MAFAAAPVLELLGGLGVVEVGSAVAATETAGAAAVGGAEAAVDAALLEEAALAGVAADVAAGSEAVGGGGVGTAIQSGVGGAAGIVGGGGGGGGSAVGGLGPRAQLASEATGGIKETLRGAVGNVRDLIGGRKVETIGKAFQRAGAFIGGKVKSGADIAGAAVIFDVVGRGLDAVLPSDFQPVDEQRVSSFRRISNDHGGTRYASNQARQSF